MMNNFQQLKSYVEAHQQDLMADAAKYRLAREHNLQRVPHPTTAATFYAPVLAQAGELLTRAGEYLQSRYSETMPALSETAEIPCVRC